MIKIQYIVLIVAMTFTGAFASLLFKKASQSIGLKALILNYNLYVGGGLYFAASLINIYVLKFVDYSVVLPLTSITYIWTMILSYFFLHEKIGGKKIVGVVLILIGAYLVALS